MLSNVLVLVSVAEMMTVPPTHGTGFVPRLPGVRGPTGFK